MGNPAGRDTRSTTKTADAPGAGRFRAFSICRRTGRGLSEPRHKNNFNNRHATGHARSSLASADKNDAARKLHNTGIEGLTQIGDDIFKMIETKAGIYQVLA